MNFLNKLYEIQSISRREEFLLACINGNIEVAKLLLYYLNEVDIKSEDNYAFRWACRCGHIKVVKLLLPYLSGADIKSRNNEAFLYACKGGYTEIVKLLTLS